METPWALALKKAKKPDDVCAHSFAYFRALFRSLGPKADVSGTNILSHDFPDSLFQNRNMMGVVIAGAVLAMLDHETNSGAQAPFLPITPEHFKTLDEIILRQAAIAGEILLTSDLVLSRVLQWERSDLRKHGRWLNALRKAALIHQRRMAAPFTDPFSREAKRQAVGQLRPMWVRLRERFAKQHSLPNPEQVKAAFEEEAASPDAPPFVSRPHNHQWWLRWLIFYRKDLVKIMLTYSVEKLFDSYAAFVSGHSNPDYVRKQISLLK